MGGGLHPPSCSRPCSSGTPPTLALAHPGRVMYSLTPSHLHSHRSAVWCQFLFDSHHLSLLGTRYKLLSLALKALLSLQSPFPLCWLIGLSHLPLHCWEFHLSKNL